MTHQKKIDNFCEDAITKQFEVIGLKYTKAQTQKKNWFSKHTWTEEQEKEFEKWFKTELKKRFRWNKYIINKEYSLWNLDYGWKSSGK